MTQERRRNKRCFRSSLDFIHRSLLCWSCFQAATIQEGDKDGSTRAVVPRDLTRAVLDGAGADAKLTVAVSACNSGVAACEIAKDPNLKGLTSVLASSKGYQYSYTTPDGVEAMGADFIRLQQDPSYAKRP